MTLPASGQMSASMINVELGRVASAPFSMNGAAERALAGKSSGTISMSDFYGKSAVSPLSATASPSTAVGMASGSLATTNSVTATPTGGIGPYTYYWYFTSEAGDVPINITSPTSDTTTFTAQPMVAGNTATAIAVCEVTATTGGTVITNDVTVTVEKP